jgi:hypothetical protein
MTITAATECVAHEVPVDDANEQILAASYDATRAIERLVKLTEPRACCKFGDPRTGREDKVLHTLRAVDDVVHAATVRVMRRDHGFADVDVTS